MALRIGLISLGCPKNQIDAEIMLAKIRDAGYEIADSPLDCDVVIVNTCAFIEDAKKEAIENILDMVQVKQDGDIKKVIVTGCLSERYRDEVAEQIPEVDAIVGIGSDGDIVDVIRSVMEDDAKQITSFPEKDKLPLCGERVLTTPSHWAYLKIAEGCSNNCTYCAIPGIRGPYRSRTEEDIYDEAVRLAEGGVKELVLVAQDTTFYGRDLYNEYRLPSLLRKLCLIDGIKWIRLLYCYPDRITDSLLDVMASEEKVLDYLDIPVQHADKNILRAMGRDGDRESLLALTAHIREKMPDAVIRTTVMTGFPGEDDDAFGELCDLVDQARFDKLGCFVFSPEEGTPAAELPDEVDADIARERSEIITEKQFDIQKELQESLIGTELECIAEDYDAYSDSYSGRTWRDAPEIDNNILFTCAWQIEIGDIVRVKVLALNDEGYDLIGEVV